MTKINLTKLLFIDSRVVRVGESDIGTTGDTSYIPKVVTTGVDEPYSFELVGDEW